MRLMYEFVLPLLLASCGLTESSKSWDIRAGVKIEYDSGLVSGGDIVQSYTGAFASYSRSNNVGGTLRVIEDESFGCNGSTRLDTRGQIVLLKLMSNSCDDYLQAQAAEDSGAVGLVFYTPGDMELRGRKSEERSLTLTVALVRTDVDLAATFRNKVPVPQVTITKEYHEVYETARTFYFVVFAFCVLMALSCLWFVLSYIRRCCLSARARQRRAQRDNASQQMINKLPVKTYKPQKDMPDGDCPTCAVCLECFSQNDTIRILPCKHEYHKKCVDPWLKIKKTCPICKQSISLHKSRHAARKPEQARDQEQNEIEFHEVGVEMEESSPTTREVWVDMEGRDESPERETAPPTEGASEESDSLSASSTVAFI